MTNKRTPPDSAATLHKGNMNKCYTKHNLASQADQLQSKIKVILLEMYCRGYLSERLTKNCFRLFRLMGA
jgi:hypothetical protein